MVSKDPPAPAQPLLVRVAGWSIGHPLAAIAGWFALVLVAILATALVPGQGARNVDPGESGRAEKALYAQQAFEPIRESVLIQPVDDAAGTSFADDAALTATTRDLVERLRDPAVNLSKVESPLDPGGTALISADGRSGLVTFEVAGEIPQVRQSYAAAVTAIRDVAAAHPQVRVAQAGDRSLSEAVDEGIKSDFQRSELIALPLTLVILLLVFGSLVAAGIPLLLAASAVGATLALLQVVDHWLPINSATSAMVLLIGMAVGVDYCLFYLRREREERVAGRSVGESLRITAGTSGRVIVISGITVILCIGGLLATGIGVFRGLAVGTMLVVGLAVIGSVTVLPALLSLLGHRVDRLRVPWLGKFRTTAQRSAFWTALARAVVRRPLLWAGGGTVALLLLAVPALQMHAQDPAVINSLPRTVPTVDAAIRMQEAFPGSAAPVRVVIWNPDGSSADTPAVREAVDRLRAQAGSSDGAIHEPIATVVVGDVVVVRVPIAGSGTDPATNRALTTLREQALPEAFGTVDNVQYAVTGRAAVAHDFAEKMVGRSPLVFAIVLTLAFVLLLVAFRSLVVPVISIVLNLLSIAAAYGVLTWVFQDGHLGGLLGFTPYGGVVGWLPLFMFVLLFGLSMDYHIFILSRIRERWAAGENARASVIDGVGTSAGVVTSAAVVMTAVFLVFVSLSAIEYKMLGLGMAVAVILDATVVRGVLLPATVALFGDRAWQLPRALHWIPGGTEPGERPADSSPLPEYSRTH
jgi:RND superfamily putative drug exporter